MHHSLVGVIVLLLGVSAVGHGQGQSSPRSAQGSESSSVIGAAFLRPVSKPHDERYPFVRYCQVQADRIVDSVEWGQRADMIPWSPTETLPAVVQARARECLAQFNVEQVGRLFFESVAELALVAGADSLLPPLIDSLLVIQRESREAGYNIYPGQGGRFLRTLLSAAPARVEMARLMMARSPVLNSIAYPKGHGNKLILRDLVDFYQALNKFGVDIADIGIMEEGRDSVLSLFHEFEKEYPDSVNEMDRMWYAATALRMNRYIYAFRFGSDSILKNAEREVALVQTLSSRGEREVRGILGLILTGNPPPSAEAPFTFFRDGVTRIPEPGKTMVVLRVGENCEVNCATEIMRFKSLIGDVPMVMLAEVYGNVRRSNPGTAAENAEALRAHLQDSLGVKLSLIVDTVPRHILPAPDLRYLYGTSRLHLNWAGAGSAMTFSLAPRRTDAAGYVVIDKHGRVVWEASFISGRLDNKRFAVHIINKIAAEQ